MKKITSPNNSKRETNDHFFPQDIYEPDSPAVMQQNASIYLTRFIGENSTTDALSLLVGVEAEVPVDFC